MCYSFDHHGNVNCVFTRVYALLSNKHKGINYLATLSDGLSFNINSDSFNFKWKLLEALPIRVKQEESASWLFSWQCFFMAVAYFSLYFEGFSVKLTFPNVYIGAPEGEVSFHRRKHHCRCCTWICKLISNSWK